MKLNSLETHDRLIQFKKQADYISEGCQQCINNRPKEYLDHPFYIFAHKRTLGVDEKIALFNEDLRLSLLDPRHYRQYQNLDSIPEARMIWEPRLTKPQKAQSNSMLFRAYPPGDNIKIIWMLPAPEIWEQFEKNKLTQNEVIYESIQMYKSPEGRKKLEGIEDDELPDYVIKGIMLEMGRNARARKAKPEISAASSTASS